MAEATAAVPLREIFGVTQKPAPEDAFHQLRSLLRAAGSAPQRRWLALLALGIVAAIGANMVGQVRLNVWLGDFYDALEQRQLSSILNQILVFLAIVAGLLTMVVAETWLREMLEVCTREWLTHDLLDQWLVSRRAYLLPLGTLRAAVCYPDAPDGFEQTGVRGALERVGLSHLTPALDREDRWDKRLRLEEQQRLVLARLLLSKPRAVFLDDVMNALGGEQRALAVSIFERELADTTVISIGDAPVNDDFYHRIVQIVRTPPAPDLRRTSEPDALPGLRPPPRPQTGASVIPSSLAPMHRQVDPSHPPQLKRR